MPTSYLDEKPKSLIDSYVESIGNDFFFTIVFIMLLKLLTRHFTVVSEWMDSVSYARFWL